MREHVVEALVRGSRDEFVEAHRVATSEEIREANARIHCRMQAEIDAYVAEKRAALTAAADEVAP